MRGPLPASIWLLLVVWVGITVAAVIWGIPHLEDHLGESGEAALGNQPVGVEFAGRDAQLTGQVTDSSEIDLAVARMRELRGVRRVYTRGIVTTPDATAAVPAVELVSPEVTLAFDDGVVTVSGTVPDRTTADAIVDAAVARWGSEQVVDEVGVSSNTSGAAWLAGIVSAVSGVDALREGSIAIGPAGVLVQGSVTAADTVTDVEETLTAAFGPEVPLENRLEVVVLAAPGFVAELLDDGMVSLGGVMPDQASIDAIAVGASGVYGSDAVVNEMSVGLEIASPAYLSSLPATFGAIEGLNPWRFTVEAGQAELTGLAVSEAAVLGTASRLETVFAGTGLTIDNQAAVDPAAVATVLTDLLKGTATFRVASAELSLDATVLLDEAIDILADNTATVLIVEGHTDDVGSEEDNLALSEERAQAVVDYLVAGGIDAARLTAIGYGESRPIASNDTAEGRSENRRIQFVVEEGEN
jgi:OOP family OmpA-OmpF porin